MKAGTKIKLPDGRYGTVVYNGLEGVGIKFGLHDVTLEDLAGNGNLFDADIPPDYNWKPDAMLREPYAWGSPNMEYVGKEFTYVDDE